jgi:CheY-like chemotaxis protein/two-component sensor histidine kinase
MTVGRIDLQRLFNGMSGLLTQSVGPAVQVRIHIDPDAQFVSSDANQLELALLNLAVNARDAMSGSGILTIRTRRALEVDRSLPSGEYVDLLVTDNGTGMTSDVRARAIEPFFTTKPTGQGTGLGLSQVYGVVRESGGALSLESEPGQGTTVRLTLRSAPADVSSVLTRPHRTHATAPPSGDEHQVCILVVDDDRLVRRFMTESLRGLGYRVMDADNGATALELLDKHKVELLLVDFAMPGMNGAEVARAAQSKHPGLKTLIVSGYADTAALEAALGPARHLRKPFDLTELRAAVSDILQSDA